MSHLKSVRSTIVTTAMLLTCVAPPSFAQVEGEHISVSSAHPVAAIQDTETTAQRDARMAWWRDARFGMFIHWGLYSIPAGTWKGCEHCPATTGKDEPPLTEKLKVTPAVEASAAFLQTST